MQLLVNANREKIIEAAYQYRPSRGNIFLSVAGNRTAQDWIECYAVFDSQSDEDWMSYDLADHMGLKLRRVEPILYQDFKDRGFVSTQSTELVRWKPNSASKKSIITSFRILSNTETSFVNQESLSGSRCHVLIGKQTILTEKIFPTTSKYHEASLAAGIIRPEGM